MNLCRDLLNFIGSYDIQDKESSREPSSEDSSWPEDKWHPSTFGENYSDDSYTVYSDDDNYYDPPRYCRDY